MKRIAQAPVAARAAFALTLAVTLLGGCSDEGTTKAPASGTVAATPPSSSGTLPLPPDGVGKPACDGYIAKMRACIDKLPEADRAAKRAVLDKTLATWREQAQRPEMQQNLETTCKAAASALDTDPLCK
jgi:hypothetical protein